MNTEIIAWGHNPGQRFVKDSISAGGKRRDLRPYPAVIAPWAKADDLGLSRRTTDLTAHIGDAIYIGGTAAERLPLANRQQASARLDAESPIYSAFAQMSAQHAGLTSHRNGERPTVLIATALPVAWRLDDATAEARLESHIRQALGSILHIKSISIQSEPNAVVCAELLDDAGQMRADAAGLASGLVCVGDIGGGTLNRSVLEELRALPGLAASPPLGSGQVVRELMMRTGAQYIDAERRLERAAKTPGHDPQADGLLQQYREAVVSEFQEAWRSLRPSAYLFAGGTVHWIADDLRRAFGARCRIVGSPQQAIAIGLWRYARRKASRGR
jgi:hypothetical protein